MSKAARVFVRGALEWWDRAYHRRHRLRPIGPVLLVGCERYRGPDVSFADGTRLAAGDVMGTLHFHNAKVARLGGEAQHMPTRFARMLLQSLHTLAACARRDPHLRDVRVYQGISWLRPHGKRLGFDTEPLPAGRRKRLLTAHFRLLVWAFAASPRTRATADPQPRVFWLTRSALLRNFAAPPQSNEGSAE